MTERDSEDRLRWLDLESASYTTFGTDNWEWALPQLLPHIDTDPAFVVAVPAKLTAHSDHRQVLGYWGALHYILLHRLGWARPGKGLRSWIDADTPLDDPTLRLVSRLWDQDGSLADYVAWTIRHPYVFMSADGPTDNQVTDIEPGISDDWRVWERDHVNLDIDLAFTHGSDPFHLGSHSGMTGAPDPSARLDVVNVGSRRALYRSNTASGWYFDVLARIQQLPDVAPNSWHVDVIIDGIGHLGTYRRSTVTGLLFTGSHTTHLAGN